MENCFNSCNAHKLDECNKPHEIIQNIITSLNNIYMSLAPMIIQMAGCAANDYNKVSTPQLNKNRKNNLRVSSLKQ